MTEPNIEALRADVEAQRAEVEALRADVEAQRDEALVAAVLGLGQIIEQAGRRIACAIIAAGVDEYPPDGSFLEWLDQAEWVPATEYRRVQTSDAPPSEG